MSRVAGRAAPARIVALCADHSIRLISPVSGLTITMVPPEAKVLPPNKVLPGGEISISRSSKPEFTPNQITVSVAYGESMQRIFCLMQDGSIKIYSTTGNPCHLVAIWPSPFPHDQRVMEIALSEMKFDATNPARSALSGWMGLTGHMVSETHMLVLFGATLNGHLVRFDVELGKVLSFLPSTTTGRV